MKEYMEKTKVGTGMIVVAGNINGVTSILSDVTITIVQTDSNSQLTGNAVPKQGNDKVLPATMNGTKGLARDLYYYSYGVPIGSVKAYLE